MVLSLVCSTREINGVPMFPARIVGKPGLGMIKSCSRKVFSRWPPNSRPAPAPRNGTSASPISFSERESVAVTFAPRAAQNNAVATPVLASPTTSTRLPRNSNGFGIFPAKPRERILPLPQLQRRQRKQRENQRRDPEPYDHFRFAPAQQFEMVVDRSHKEDPLAAQLERAHLQNHRERFHDKDSPHEKEQDLLLDDHGDHAERPSQRERADVAHENLRGMRVVPKKTERGTDERAAENRQFADARDVLNLEIGRPAGIAADVGQHRERARGDDRASDRQAVQPVG